MNTHLTAQVTAGFNEVFGSYSTDAAIIIVGIAFFFGYGVFLGKTRLISLLMSLYVGSVLFLAFPYTSNISIIRGVTNAGAWSSVIVFIVILILTHLVMNKIVLTAESFGTRKWTHFGVLAVGGLCSVIGLSLTILPFARLFTFSAQLSRFVHAPLTLFAFVFIPLILIYITNKY